MSDMSMDEMRALKNAAYARSVELNGLAAAVQGQLNLVHQDLLKLKAGGFSPNRIESTLALANEARRMQENNNRRIGSLSAGIGEL